HSHTPVRSSYHSCGGAASKVRGVKKPGARWGWLRAVGKAGPAGLPAQPSDLPANLAAGEGCRVDVDVRVAGLHSLDQFVKRDACEDDVVFCNRSACQLAAELTLDELRRWAALGVEEHHNRAIHALRRDV